MSNNEQQDDQPSSLEPREPALEQLVCDVCFEANLTQAVHICQCASCETEYCRHHASAVDPGHCVECVSQVEVTESIIQKTELHTSPDGSSHVTRSRKARQIKVGGLHWLFIQRKIPTLSDAELTVAIEYHRALYDSLVYEREKRRIDMFHRNAGKQFKLPVTTDGTTVTTTVTTKKSRTTKTVKQDKASANMQALIELLKAKGLSIDQIKAMAGTK